VWVLLLLPLRASLGMRSWGQHNIQEAVQLQKQGRQQDRQVLLLLGMLGVN
jgi:hypothetical protein